MLTFDLVQSSRTPFLFTFKLNELIILYIKCVVPPIRAGHRVLIYLTIVIIIGYGEQYKKEGFGNPLDIVLLDDFLNI